MKSWSGLVLWGGFQIPNPERSESPGPRRGTHDTAAEREELSCVVPIETPSNVVAKVVIPKKKGPSVFGRPLDSGKVDFLCGTL